MLQDTLESQEQCQTTARSGIKDRFSSCFVGARVAGTHVCARVAGTHSRSHDRKVGDIQQTREDLGNRLPEMRGVDGNEVDRNKRWTGMQQFLENIEGICGKSSSLFLARTK